MYVFVNVSTLSAETKYWCSTSMTSVEGARKHEQWLDDVEAIMWMKGLDEKTAAALTKMSAEGHAKKLLEKLKQTVVKKR